jgi:glycosyltransferase involved in cell wall biosynthesis
MKIVLANNYYYLRGGSERVFLDEMEILKKYGHEVAPFSRCFDKNYNAIYSEYFAPPIEYENASFLEKVRASFKLIYSFETKNSFGKLLSCFTPELVHAHNIYGRLTSSIVDEAKKHDVPVVMTLHDYKLICPSYLMLDDGMVCEGCLDGSFYKCALNRCHKGSFSSSVIYTLEAYFNRLFKKYEHVSYFISPSRFLLNKLIEAGMPRKKMIHIPNFLDVDNFQDSYKNNGSILFVGRLSREKGVRTLLRAVKGLEIPVRIVGEGPLGEEFKAFTKTEGMGNVKFEGYKSGDELKEAFRDASFLVFPSEWYENAPMTILEAFAYGKPVIGSRIGGIPEMIVEGETGLLFQTGDHLELREKIRYLFSNPQKIQEMGKKAREKIEKGHNAEMHYNKLMEVYQKAL